MKKLLPVLIGVTVLVGAGAFYGGMTYANAKSPMRTFQRGSGGAGAGPGGGQGFRGGQGGMMGGFVTGEILSNDGKSLTVKGRDGGSKIILLGETTEVSVFTAGKASDLEIGKSVTVQGKPNTDGSITAQSVQLRPPMVAPAGSSANPGRQQK